MHIHLATSLGGLPSKALYWLYEDMFDSSEILSASQRKNWYSFLFASRSNAEENRISEWKDYPLAKLYIAIHAYMPCHIYSIPYIKNHLTHIPYQKWKTITQTNNLERPSAKRLHYYCLFDYFIMMINYEDIKCVKESDCSHTRHQEYVLLYYWYFYEKRISRIPCWSF
jgi:hypothetical protein